MGIPELLLIAKARKKRKDKASLVSQIASMVPVPRNGINGKDGRAGKDAPTMEEILKEIKPLIPESKIVHTTKTIREEIDEEKVRKLIKEELPEPRLPEIQVIEKEIDFDEGKFLTKKEFDKALKRIDQAIQVNRGGGGAGVQALDQFQLVNIIEASETLNIIDPAYLQQNKVNIVHATVPNSTVQLPPLSANYLVLVEDAVKDGGNITITRAEQ